MRQLGGMVGMRAGRERALERREGSEWKGVGAAFFTTAVSSIVATAFCMHHWRVGGGGAHLCPHGICYLLQQRRIPGFIRSLAPQQYRPAAVSSQGK
jgi:hypothetical protein